jgi:zinc transport system substrate-binding protein
MIKHKPIYHPHLLIAILTVLMLTLSACQPATAPQHGDEDRSLVTVSILPQAYFVARIGGDAVSVNVMVGPGEEPHTYEPKPDQMRALSDSQLFFTIGTEYEAAWLPRFRDVNPKMTIVDSATGIQRLPDQHDDHHEDQEAHPDESEVASDEQGLDPHVWLSPANGKIIAQNILNALVTHMPEREAYFQMNYDSLINDIDQLDGSITALLADLDQRAFMVFHPAWGYFANQYNLEQIPVQIGGQEPSASEMADLIAIAQSEQIRVIFIQPTFNTANAAAIAQEINAEIAVVDPLADDWLENLERVAAAFADALQK